MAIKSAPATKKFDKLRRLLGQHTTAAFRLNQWLQMQTRPWEQWRGETVFVEQIAKYREQLALLDYQIAAEMRARLAAEQAAEQAAEWITNGGVMAA